MKITIISAYTWYNKGDAGILLGTVSEIKEFWKSKYKEDELSFSILSFTPQIDKEKYKAEDDSIKNVESNLFNPYPIKKTKIKKAIAIIKMLIQYLFLTLVPRAILKNKNNIKLVDESDLIIVCGGGFLGGKKFNSLMHLCQILILSRLNKNMVLWGTSIEPPSNTLLDMITKFTLKKIKIILPREEITLNYLKTFLDDNHNKIIYTPDMAFKLVYKDSDNKKLMDIINSNEKKCGITIRDWNFPKSSDPRADKKNYKLTMVDTIEKLIESGMKVYFIPQVIFYGDDDRIIAREIKGMISNERRKGFIVLEDDFSPSELKLLISKLDLFIGTRMHSNIFSSTVQLPPIAIAYESKTNGIMNILGLQEYVINIEDVSTDKIEKMIKQNILNRKELIQLLDDRIVAIKKEIRNATEEVFDLLEKGSK